MAIKKILCLCGAGIVTSLMMVSNCKTALKQLGIKGVEVDHASVDDIVPGAADLFVCGADLVEKAQAAGSAIGLKNILSAEEMTQKLKEAFGK